MIPLSFPASGASQQEFEIERVDYASEEANGNVGGVSAGEPKWYGVWTIGSIGARRSDSWRSFWSRLRGAQRRFFVRDLARPYPLAHITGFAGMTRAGGGAFDGSATSWSETIDADGNSLVTLHGLPVGLTLSMIDYIGFKWDAAGSPASTYDRRALVRVVEGGGGIADGSGNLQVMSEPPIPLVVPGTAKAHLDQPCCIMALRTGNSSLQAIDRGLRIKGGTISAIQDLRE